MTMNPADPSESRPAEQQGSQPLTKISPIPNSGRGVLALHPIPSGTQVLHSQPPLASVIFRPYRKEVCASCFHYDRGRTLPIRHVSTGKWFCREACRHEWLEAGGELGVRAWENLNVFVQKGSGKGGGRGGDDADCLLPDRGDRPGRQEIEAAWTQVTEDYSSERSPSSRNAGDKPSSARRPQSSSSSTSTIDPDILTYLLSATLSHHRSPAHFTSTLSSLSQDPEPYTSTHDLSRHTTSHRHLASILPKPLLPSLSPTTSALAVSAASHNSFGLRGGSADGEEYMGYALFPDASYFNHSCRPNISKLRVGRRWVFTADGELGEGEECCITYLGGEEKEMRVEERRARLQEHWGLV